MISDSENPNMSDSDNEKHWTGYGGNRGTIRIRYPSAVNLLSQTQLTAEPEHIQPPQQTHQQNQQTQSQEEITLLQQMQNQQLQQEQRWEQQWQEIQQQYHQEQQQNQSQHPQVQNLETERLILQNSDYSSFSPVSPEIELESCFTCNESEENVPLLGLLPRSASFHLGDLKINQEIRENNFSLNGKRRPVNSNGIEQYGSSIKFSNDNSQSQNSNKNKSIYIANDSRSGDENLYRQVQKNKAADQNPISFENNTSGMAAAAFESCSAANKTLAIKCSATDPFNPGNTIVAKNNNDGNPNTQMDHGKDSKSLKRGHFGRLSKKIQTGFWRVFPKVK